MTYSYVSLVAKEKYSKGILYVGARLSRGHLRTYHASCFMFLFLSRVAYCICGNTRLSGERTVFIDPKFC